MADGLVVGIDTHKDVHVAVVLDRAGTPPGGAELPGHRCREHPADPVARRAGHGHRCAASKAPAATDTGWPGCWPTTACRSGRSTARIGPAVAVKGKSDPVDAENAARAVLAGEATAVPKDRRGFVGELRLLVLTRRSAVKARTQASNQIKAFLLDADDELRARLHGLRKGRFGRACAALEPADGLRPRPGCPGPPVAGPGHRSPRAGEADHRPDQPRTPRACSPATASAR